MNWPLTDVNEIITAIENFDESTYAGSRNFTDGSVSMLSPYLSRGVISTKFVFDKMVSKKPDTIRGKFVQELLWRDYFQQLLLARPDLHKTPIRNNKDSEKRAGMPIAVLNGSTGILAIDTAINTLYETGYIHNHLRLYIAALCCTISKYNFQAPAQWMYYHLLDADAASNFGSWQWVSGELTGKSYLANQENINHYTRTVQKNTFLDKSYDELARMSIPDILSESAKPIFETLLPDLLIPDLDNRPILIYNFYNLDPFWHSSGDYNRILLLEPSHFEQFPVSEKVLNFTLKLARNINGLHTFTGEFDSLRKAYPDNRIVAKEHPLFQYKGAEIEPRDWIIPQVKGYYQSFSKYYQDCLKFLSHD